MAKKTYHGSCHCGRVRFEAEIDLAAEGTGKCNCTSCWKKRAWTTRAKVEDFRSLSGGEDLTGYKVAGETAEGGFCRHCGVFTYGLVSATEWNPAAYYSISVAALDDLDPAELVAAKVTYYDGRNDAWERTPAETRHL